MEQNFGFIHEPLEIKILILYVLNRLPEPVNINTLAELVLIDDGFNYFDFADCCAELLESGHVVLGEKGYASTPKGRENGSITEDSLPYSVRLKAEKAVSAVALAQKRQALIGAKHAVRRKGGCTVSLSLSDGVSSLMEMELYAPDEKQAAIIEKNFRKDAEKIYLQFMERLCGEGQKKD